MLCVVWEIYPPFLMQYIIYPFGEDSLVYVCTVILTGVHLSIFFIMQEHNLSSGAKNPATGKKLWEESEKFVGLQPNDPHI